jgi:RNA polymerase primary sigma factor
MAARYRACIRSRSCAAAHAQYLGLSGGRAVSLHEIGDQFDLSMERVRQVKEKATRKLRQTARIEALKAFL